MGGGQSADVLTTKGKSCWSMGDGPTTKGRSYYWLVEEL